MHMPFFVSKTKKRKCRSKLSLCLWATCIVSCCLSCFLLSVLFLDSVEASSALRRSFCCCLLVVFLPLLVVFCWFCVSWMSVCFFKAALELRRCLVSFFLLQRRSFVGALSALFVLFVCCVLLLVVICGFAFFCCLFVVLLAASELRRSIVGVFLLFVGCFLLLLVVFCCFGVSLLPVCCSCRQHRSFIGASSKVFLVACFLAAGADPAQMLFCTILEPHAATAEEASRWLNVRHPCHTCLAAITPCNGRTICSNEDSDGAPMQPKNKKHKAYNKKTGRHPHTTQPNNNNNNNNKPHLRRSSDEALALQKKTNGWRKKTLSRQPPQKTTSDYKHRPNKQLKTNSAEAPAKHRYCQKKHKQTTTIRPPRQP